VPDVQFPKVSHQRGELGIFSDFGFDDAHEVFRGLEKQAKEHAKRRQGGDAGRGWKGRRKCRIRFAGAIRLKCVLEEYNV